MKTIICIIAAATVTGCSTPDGDDISRINNDLGVTGSVYDRPIMNRKAREFFEDKKGKDNGPISVECRQMKSVDGQPWESDVEKPWQSIGSIFGTGLFGMTDRFVSASLMLLCLADGHLYTECAKRLGDSLQSLAQDAVNANAQRFSQYISRPASLRNFECRWGYVPGYHPTQVPQKMVDPKAITEEDRFVERMRGDAPAAGSVACTIEEMIIIDGVATCLKLCPMSAGPGCPNGPGDIFDGTTFEQGAGTGGDL